MWFRPSYMEGDSMILAWTPSASETVFTEVTATLTFNDDDIRAVYMDWDDGTDSAGAQSNKKEEAVYQWYQTTEPKKVVVLKHTYTASGTFNPVVQTVNSKGFFSRYTSSGAAASDSPKPYTDATTAGTWPKMAMADGTATGIMRIENRTVKSGIDNSIFNVEGPKDLFVSVAPTLSAAELAYLCETGAAATGKVEIDVKCELTYGIRDGDGGAGTQTDTGGEKIVKTLSLVLSGANLTGNVTGIRNVLASGAHNLGALESGAQVSNILEVKYKNPKYMGTNTAAYTENEVFNRFKVFFVASSSALAKYVPVTYVSAGDPIKKASEPISNFTMDFSQSRAKASNISLASYRYDIGKSWFQSANTWGTGSATTFSDATSGTSVTKVSAYTYMTRPDGLYNATAAYNVFSTAATSIWDTTASDSIQDQIVLDDYGRFYPQYHLTRMSTEPSSSADNISTITDNKPDVFRITPAISWSTTSNGTTAASAANAKIFPTKIQDSGTNASRSKLYTAEAFNNTSGSSGLVDLAAVNDMTFYDVSNTARANAREYLLLMFDKKTNKVFFNMSPYADNIMSALGTDPVWGIAGVSYLAIENKDTPLQNAYWRPLEFDDSTAVTKEYRDVSNEKYTNVKASLSKSGYLSFDMPLDWQNISLSGACGGVFNKTTIPLAGDAHTFDLGATLAIGTVGTAVAGTVIGDYIPFTMTTNPIPSTVSNSDVGSFKYMFIRVDDGTPAVSGAYWVTKDGADGYDSASGILYLHLGKKEKTTGATITKGYIRRVNSYDVLDGFSKVFMASGGSATELPGVGDSTLGGQGWSVPWTNTYQIISGSTVGDALEDAWAGTEKYLLKVVLSGTDAPSTNIFPEIWNIFDATRGYGDIVREVDNSAYNLNSLSITSDISVSRAGNFYQAITRKGKVFIARVGTPIQTISFGSVALGDTTSATPFVTWGARNTLYGHLHMVRKIQADGVRVYWDEPQKDGTYVRFWGVVTDVAETLPAGGPRVIINYTFNMVVEEIALIDANFKLMTDVFPLGSVEYDRSYT